MSRKKTLEEWQEIANKACKVTVLGFSSKENGRVRVDVKCTTCGYSYSMHAQHLKRAGCRKCSGAYQPTSEEALRSIQEKHPNLSFKPFVYKTNQTHVSYKCNTCGLEHTALYSNMVNHNQGCPSCAGNLRLVREVALQKLKEAHPSLDFCEFEYINNLTMISYKCNICGHIGAKSYKGFIYKKQGCQKCSKRLRITTEEARIILEKKHHTLKFGEFDYKNRQTVVPYTCLQCGFNHKSSFVALTYNGCGCPDCAGSRLERDTSSLLKRLEIPFEVEYKFSSCRNKNPLPFDVYVKDFNLLIECHGRQHYVPVAYFSKREGFEYRKKNDAIKLKFCNDNHINILYVIDIKNAEYKDIYPNTIFIDELEDYLVNLIKDKNK